MPRWQYQRWAKPLTPPGQEPERTTPDKWHPLVETPQINWKKRAGYAVAVYAASLFFVNPRAAEQEAGRKVPTWHPPIEKRYVPKLARPHLYPYFSIDTKQLTLKERITPDKWYPPFEYKRRDLARNQYLYPYFFPDSQLFTAPGVEVVTVDKWFVRTAEPVRVAARLREYPPFVVDPFALTRPETAQVDKWHPQPNQPRQDLRRWQFTYPSLFFEPGERDPGLLTKWAQPIQRPPAGRPKILHAMPFYFAPDQQPVPRPEAFVFRSVIPVRRIVQRPEGIQLLPPPQFPPVTLDQWFMELQRPVPPAPRLTEYPSFFIDPVALTTVIAGERLFLTRVTQRANRPLNIEVYEHFDLSSTPAKTPFTIELRAGNGDLIPFNGNPEGHAPIALVAHTAAGSVDGGFSTTTPAIDTSNADFIIISVGFFDANGAGTLSDSYNNSWTPLTAASFVGLGRQHYYCVNPSVGTGHTFHMEEPGINFSSLCVAAFSGVNQTAPFDQETQGGFNGNGILAGPVTPSTNGQLLVAAVSLASTSGAGAAISDGFIILDTVAFSSGQHFGGIMAYKIQTIAHAENAAWTFTAVDNLAATIATFKNQG